MGKMRRSRTFKKEQENNVISIDEAREQRREKRRLEKEKKEEKQNRPDKAAVSERRRVRERRRKLVYFLIIVLIIGVIVYCVWNIWSLKERERQAQEEFLAKQEEKERLQLELDHVESEDAVEQEAREQLHMIKPGETVYILPTAPETDPEAVTNEAVGTGGTDEAAEETGND